MNPKQVERLEKTFLDVWLASRVSIRKGFAVGSRFSHFAAFGRAVEKGVIDIYYLKGGVAMELRFARAARPPKISILVLEATARNIPSLWRRSRKACSSMNR